MDKIVAFSFLVKIRGTQMKTLSWLCKEIYYYRLSSRSPEKGAAFRSQTMKDASEWKLNPAVFQNIYNMWGRPDIDLFSFSDMSPSPNINLLEARALQ